MMVSVRGAFPYCLIVVCLSSTCRLGVTPAVISLVREPSRCRARAAADRTGVEDETDLIGRPMSSLSRMTCSRKIRPEIGVSSIWVQGELGPQDRQVVAVASGPIGRGERMRGVGLPFAVNRAEGDSTQIEKSLTREIRSAIAWPISTCAESTRMPMSDSSS